MDKYTPGQLARVLKLPEPTAEQAAVIAAPLGPLAVIAGAGSGKSETMAARLVWLVANGMVRPDRVLGLTFTRKAAAELAERVRLRLDALRRAGLAGSPADDEAGPWAGEPVISTYHAYAGRLVSDHALREGLEPSMRLITAALSWQLAVSIVAAYDGPMDEVQWTPQTVTAAVLDLAGDLAEHLRSSDDVRGVGEWLDAEAARWPGRGLAGVRKVIESQRTREQLLPLVDRYAAAKRAREVLDHGDQVRLAAQIAMRHPEVGAAERTRYQVVLLDEYQDTSHAQLKLLNALFGNGHPVTAVGDPCQSIYGWRGASAGNLRRFARDFPARSGSPATVQKLSTSFRNAGRVLDAAAVLQAELRAQAPDVPRARARARPGRQGRRVRGAAADGDRRVGVGGRPGRRAARAARRDRRRTASCGRTAGSPGCARRTSPCCAGSGPSSCRCAGRLTRAASRARWWGSAACCRCQRCRTWWRRCACCTTPPPRTRSPAC